MGKYLSREQSLRNKISEEMTHPKPSLDRIIGYVNEFEQANLDTIEKLNRVKKLDDNKIKGALKQTINAHGPITMDFISSATKRINGSIMLEKNSTIIKENENPFNPKPFSVKSLLLGFLIGALFFSAAALFHYIFY